MPSEMLLDTFEMPMEPFPALAGPVVVNHTGAIKRNQDFIPVCFMNLPVGNVWRIYGAYLSSLA